MQRISIFGCGWLGRALADSLKANYFIQASVQTQHSYNAFNLRNKCLLNEENAFYSTNFYQTDLLIIAIPPKGNYLQTLERVLSYLDEEVQIILLSSTSVYTQSSAETIETDTRSITTPSLMLEAERFVRKKRPESLVLRLGGLMGYDRVAGSYSVGKTFEHDVYVNYVHRDDVVSVITLCIEKRVKADYYNVVAPIHRSRKEVYHANADRFGFAKARFTTHVIKGKKVSCEKLIKALGYHFSKEDPLFFW